MKLGYILSIVLLLAILYILYMRSNENLCIKMPYGYVTDVPVSSFINSNMALVNSTSIGQAPLGDPRFWKGTGSPITQGQYGYGPAVSLEDSQPFDRTKLNEFAAQMPVYTEGELPSQCTPLN